MANIFNDYIQSMYGKFYEECKRMKGGENPLITFTSIILMVDLVDSKSSYTLKLKENSGSDNPNEMKLTTEEMFLPLYSGLGIQKFDTDAAGNMQDGNFPLLTYADPNYFVGASGGQLEVDSLSLIHAKGAHLAIKQDGIELHRKAPTHLMGYRPEGQYLTTAASGQPQPQLPTYGPTLLGRGYGKLYNEFVLKGKYDNEIIVSLAAGDNSMISGAVDAAGNAVTTRNRLVIDILGFKCHSGVGGTDPKFCQL